MGVTSGAQDVDTQTYAQNLGIIIWIILTVTDFLLRDDKLQ